MRSYRTEQQHRQEPSTNITAATEHCVDNVPFHLIELHGPERRPEQQMPASQTIMESHVATLTFSSFHLQPFGQSIVTSPYLTSEESGTGSSTQGPVFLISRVAGT